MKNDYLIQKKPLSALVLFSVPIIVGNLFQQFYTMADSAIVGRFVSEQALAAVGASCATAVPANARLIDIASKVTGVFLWLLRGYM